MMKALINVALAILVIYLFFDLVLYYLDCDILNITPKDDIYKILTLVLSCSTLYYMNERKAGKWYEDFKEKDKNA